MTRTVVIGIGNAMRGDDAAGVEVAEKLRGVACDEEPSRLIEAWEGADAVVLIDTVVSGAPPGTLHRFDASEEAIPARALRSSTHAIGLADTIELARALGKLPPRVVIYGIEGATFETGAPLSPDVEAAVGRLVETIEEETCTSAP
ncbi:MAG TPA: hydrogenase maturation protease [Gaiellaceae bacterium]|nr:hydrogenase maturation protease [Gaiellaceae bacterium]